MKCLFCDSTNFKTQKRSTVSTCHSTEYHEYICEKGHFLYCRIRLKCGTCGCPEEVFLREGIWVFSGIKFPGKMTDIAIYEDNSWGCYRLSELTYCTDIPTKNYIIDKYLTQQYLLKKERNQSRTAWLLYSLRLRKWINRDIAKMIGVYLNLKPFIFF